MESTSLDEFDLDTPDNDLSLLGRGKPLLKESDMRRVIARSPRDQEMSAESEALPAWDNELDRAIAQQRDPKLRAILVAERQQRNRAPSAPADSLRRESAPEESGVKPFNILDINDLPPIQKTTGSDYVRGLKEYIPQTKEMIGSAKVIAGLGLRKSLGEGTVGNYLIESGLENRANGAKDLEKIGGQKASDSFSEAITMGPGAVVDWAQHGFGQVTGNLIETLGTMALGTAIGGAVGGPATPVTAVMGAGAGLLGKALVKKGVKETAEKLLAESGIGVAEAYLKKEAGNIVGANTAMVAGAALHGLGETGGRAIDEVEKNGGTVNDVDLSQVLPAAAAHATGEYFGDKILAKGVLGEGTYRAAGKGALPYAQTVAGNALKVGAKEAPIEAFQTEAERYAAGLPLTNSEAGKEALDSAAQAMLFSATGVPGGHRAYFQTPTATTQPSPTAAPARQPNSPLSNAANAANAATQPEQAATPEATPSIFGTPELDRQHAEVSAFLKDRQKIEALRSVSPEMVDQALYVWRSVINNPDLPMKTRTRALEEGYVLLSNLPNFTMPGASGASTAQGTDVATIAPASVMPTAPVSASSDVGSVDPSIGSIPGQAERVDDSGAKAFPRTALGSQEDQDRGALPALSAPSMGINPSPTPAKRSLADLAAKYKALSAPTPTQEQPTPTAQLQETNDHIARTSTPMGGIESPVPAAQVGIGEGAPTNTVTQKPEQQIFVNGSSVAVTREGGFIEDYGQFSPLVKRILQALADTGSQELAVEHLRKQGDAEAADALGAETGQVVVQAVGSEKPTKVRTVYGNDVYVSPIEMSSSKTMLRMLNKDGSPKTGDNTHVHRDNLDPTGEKQKAMNAAYPKPEIISLYGKKGDMAYRSAAAAQQGARKHGVTETHEVIPASEVSPGTQGFVLRRKAKPAETKTSPLDAFEATGGEAWQVPQSQWAGIMRGHMESLGQTPVPNVEYEQYQKSQVQKALNEGKEVPANVLDGYPGMAKQESKEGVKYNSLGFEVKETPAPEIPNGDGVTSQPPAIVPPKGWRTSYGAMSKYAEALGIPLRGDDKKFKKVPVLLAEIDAKLSEGSAQQPAIEKASATEAPASLDSVAELPKGATRDSNGYVRVGSHVVTPHDELGFVVRNAKMGEIARKEDGRTPYAFATEQEAIYAAANIDTPEEMGAFGPMYRQFFHDAKGAIAHLAKMKTGEAVAALHHPEVGDIDLVWGKEGDPEKDYKGGFGLAKIAAKHPEVLESLQEFIGNLSVSKRDETWVTLESEGGKGIVRLDWDGYQKHWLVSAYKKRVGGDKTSDTAAVAGAGDTALRATDSDSSVATPPTESKRSAIADFGEKYKTNAVDTAFLASHSPSNALPAQGLTQENANEPDRNGGNRKSPLAEVPPGGVQGAEGERDAGQGGERLRELDAAGNGRADGDLRNEQPGGVDGKPGAVLSERPAGHLEPENTETVEISGETRSLEDVAERVKHDAPASEPRGAALSGTNPGNYALTDADQIGSGTAGERIRHNLAAIRLVLDLEREQRYATPEEQAVLVKYVGWGGLKNVFKPSSTSKQEREAFAELKRLLTESQLFWMGQTVLDAHYTSPKIIHAQYKILRHFGVTGGRFLEPTVGSGNFIGLMPSDMAASAKWYASEIDPLTSLIAKHAYPDAQILTGTGFQEAEFAYGRFDVAIGNPPFGDQTITDTNPKRAEISGQKIHNYILSKSAMHLRPGGIMAMVVTSRFLDTANPEARAYLAQKFNFLGAIRLPNNAFKESAGTEVTTDLVFLQKHRDGQASGDESWLDTNGRLLNADGETVTLNRYFSEHPESLFGKPTMQGTMYGSRSEKGEFALLPIEGFDAEAQLEKLLSGPWAGLKGVARKRTEAAGIQAAEVMLNREDVPVGGYFTEGARVLQRADDDEAGNAHFRELNAETPWTEKTALGKTRLGRIKGLLGLREDAYALMASERADIPSARLEAMRTDLNRRYDAFVNEFGFLNDKANTALFEDDARIEFGLEGRYKKAVSSATAQRTGNVAEPASAEKSALLIERVFFPTVEIESADTSRDGYNVSLSQRGRLDIDYIATLTKKSADSVIAELSGGEHPLIFKDPNSGEWRQEDEYLSGNVKAKLAEAKAAGASDNVRALEAVQPIDVPASEVHAEFGATWVPASIYEDFLKMLGHASAQVMPLKKSGQVEVVSVGNRVVSEFATDLENPDYSIAALFEAVANRRPLVAYDGRSDQRTVNPQRTEALKRMGKKMVALWTDWVKADDLRADLLAKTYNEQMNTTIDRKFDGVTHLVTVGANPSIRLRNSQKDSAWRMVQSPVTLMDHAVGAGKTIALITGLMERRRLGLSRKPMVVVPNHLVGQWARDWMQLYPGANILAATEKDFSRNNRKRLLARIATGTFDSVIVGHSSFGFIPVEKDAEIAFMMSEVEHLESALSEAQASKRGDKQDSRTVRSIKNRIAKRLEKIKDLQNKPRDNVATFEEMGVDYIAIDEAHEFKNLEYSTTLSNIAGMGSPEGAKKAFDLYMKVQLITARNGGVAFATGTPLSNSMVEMYTILRYLNRGALEERNLLQFDAWAKTFASIEPRDEYTATGNIKARTVMAAFNNLPELLQMYRQVADTVTMNDLKRIYSAQIRAENKKNGTSEREEFPIPKVTSGGRRLNVGAPTESQSAYMDYLMARADILEKLKGKAKQEYARIDNALWLMNDARKMSLDVRIADPASPDDPNNKVNRAARNVKAIYDRTDKDQGTQLVFCDLSTPAKGANKEARAFIKSAVDKLGLKNNSAVLLGLEGRNFEDQWKLLADRADQMLASGTLEDASRERIETFIESVSDESIGALLTADSGFSVYDALKEKLVASGIPAREIAFIHDANTTDQKTELFARVNGGKVRVLIGSSQKMGAGMNAQQRLVALHHLDAPWRPSDMEQREGRIVRQGNLLYQSDPDNFEVEIVAYSTERTFDAQMWAVLARKAGFLEQFRQGVRSIKEEGGDASGYAEFMAESTGNPIFREKIVLERAIEELDAEDRSAKMKLTAARRIMETASARRDGLNESMANVSPIADAPMASVTFEGKTYANDLSAVIEAENMLYQQEVALYQAAQEAYQARRSAWEAAAGTERGKAPAAPVKPEYPETTAKRVKEKSQWAKLISDLTLRMVAVGEGSGGRRFTLTTQDGHPFVIEAAKSWNKVDVEVAIDGIGFVAQGAPLGTKIPQSLRANALRQLFQQAQAEYRRSLSSLETALAQASVTLERVKPVPVEKIQEARARYDEVSAKVGEIAEQLAAERAGKPNRYIDMDRNRFGSSGEATAAFSRSTAPNPAGSSVEFVRQAVQELTQGLKNAPLQQVVQSVSDLPFDAPADVKGVFWKGSIYLVADNLGGVMRQGVAVSPMEIVRETVFHEMIGHYGLSGFFGSELNAALHHIHQNNLKIQIASAQWKIANRELIAQWKSQYGMSDAQVKYRSIEESLAEMAERGEKLTGWKRLASTLQSLLRAIGLHRLANALEAKTDAEALMALKKAEMFVKRGWTAARPMVDAAYPLFMVTSDAVAPRFVSQLAKAIASVPDRLSVQSAVQWKLWLASNASKLGVKKDEIVWSGVNDYLDLMGKSKVSKGDVSSYLSENGTQVKDVVLGSESIDDWLRSMLAKVEENEDGEYVGYVNGEASTEPRRLEESAWRDLRSFAEEQVNEYDSDLENLTKFHSYVVPGGENYRELLITLPKKEIVRDNDPVKDPFIDTLSLITGVASADIPTYLPAPTSPLYEETKFQSSHFDQPNILAHLRLDNRTDADGNRVLFLQEIQSDWGQEGKKNGFVGGEYERTDGGKGVLTTMNGAVQPGPFVTETKSWIALALKRAIMYAVQNGMTRVSWANGEQNAAHYDLTKQISVIYWNQRNRGGHFVAHKLNGAEVVNKVGVDESALTDLVGKEVAEKLINATPQDNGYHKLSGLDLKVGGEGMRAFYDQIVPQVANDVLKKLGGGKVETMYLSPKPKNEPNLERLPNLKQQGFTITDAMLAKVSEGVPLFSRQSGIGSPSHRAAVEYVAQPLLEGLANATGLVVVQNSNELPFVAPRNAKGVLWRGAIYLVAGNLATAIDVRETVAHELIGHFGLRGFFGYSLDSVLNGIHANSPLVQTLAASWVSQNGDYIADIKRKYGISDAQIKSISIEEALAEMAQSGKTLTGWKALAATLQSLLRAIGLHGLANALEAKTDAEALTALKKAEMFVKRGWTAARPMVDAAYPLFMTAYHGSPHDHDRFSNAHIGSGEGAQAYGWGLYFAGSKKVAEWYKEALSKTSRAYNTIDGKRINRAMLDALQSDYKNHFVQKFFSSQSGQKSASNAPIFPAIDAAIESAKADQSDYKTRLEKSLSPDVIQGTYSSDDYRDWVRGAQKQIDALESLKQRIGHVPEKKNGKLYTVELAPKESEYLDWDKPMSEQSDRVKNILDGSGIDWEAHSEQETGEHFYQRLSEEFGGDKEASETLSNMGIPGIRYLDGSSRSAGEGNSNYVIFNDADVSITAKFSRGNGGARPLASELTLADDQTDAQALNDALVEHYQDERYRTAFKEVYVSNAIDAAASVFEVAFGKRISTVAPTRHEFAGRFEGFSTPKRAGVLFVSYPVHNIIALAGHELYHDLARTRPDLHNWLLEQATPYVKNFDKYQTDLYRKMQPGETMETGEAAEELVADFTGDALADPAFLQQLADANPGKFKALLTAVKQWLNKIIARLQGNGSEEFVSDVKALRDHLAQALQAYADGKRIDEVLPGLAMSGDKTTVADKEYPVFSRERGSSGMYDPDMPVKITKISGKEIGDGPLSASRIKDWILREQQWQDAPPVINSDTGNPIGFTVQGVKDSLKRKSDAQRKAYAGLRGLLEDAVFVDFEPVREGKINESHLQGYEVYYGALEIDGELFGVRLKVELPKAETNRDRTYKDHKIVDVELHSPAASLGLDAYAPGVGDPASGPTQAGGSTISLGQLAGKNNPGIRFSRTRDTAPNAPSDSTIRASTVKDWLKNQFAQHRGWMMGALSLDHINDIYGKTLTPVADFAKTVEKMDTEKQKIADSADQIVERWRQLKSAEADRLADVMHQATLMQFDPDKYDVFSDSYDPQRVDLHTQFTALPAAAQQLYRDARDQHQKTLEMVRDGLAQRIERAGSMGAKVAAEIRLEFDKYLAEGPYFPLARFGDFIMISKRGEGDNQERIVEAFESVAQRKKVQKQRQAEGFTTNLKRNKDYSPSRDGAAGSFATEVLKHIQALEMPAEEKSKLMDTLNQIAISSLPDASYRKHFAHRKGVRGFSNDAMRAFANSQFHAAHHIARINHADELSIALDKLNASIQEDQSGDTTEPTEVYNELSKRLDLILNPNTHPIAAWLGSLGFVMSIGGSVASGITNLTQTPMVTFPMLGARYGFDSAAAQLTKASKDYFGGKWNKMSGWVMADNESLSVDERKALTSLQDMGYIDLTQAHDLAGVANTNAASSKLSFARSRAMKIIGWTFHVPEVFNRQVTALATYRLAIGKGMAHEQALQEAGRVIKQSHFNYSNSNRTRFMNGNLARVLTMFKQFSQNMTYLLWRNTYLSLKGESPEVKREARRLLMGLAATHFAFAGALGLPLGVFGISTVLLPLLAMGMGDDDEPWDWEVEFRNMLAESFGTEVGEAIAKGPMRALVPWVDFSSRVGLGDMWVRKPNKEMEGRAEVEAWLLTLLGPVAGYVGTMGTAKKAFNEGKIERGVEAMMPKMITAPLKAIRYATEGVKSMKGDDLGLELDAGDILAQALGWTPSSVSEMYEARNAIKNREHLLTMRRSEIINQWAAAKTAGDFESQQEAMAMAKTFSEKNPSMKVTPGTLAKSMAAKERNAQQIKNGVYLPKSREALREAGAFADVN